MLGNSRSLIFLATFVLITGQAIAQEFAFQSAPNMKHSFCAVETQHKNRSSTPLTKALKGQTVSVLYDLRQHEAEADPETGEIFGGYFVSIMREAARRGEFMLEEDVSPGLPDSLQNWTAYMHWGVDRYDIFADWWSIAAETLDQDILFPFGFLDMSKILVVQKPDMTRPFLAVAFSFLTPFATDLWLTVLGCSVVAGFVFVVLESGRNSEDFDPEEGRGPAGAVLHSLWLSLAMITGAGGYAPHTAQGKIFTLAWSFLVLLVVSAYTANLASFMVVKSTPHVPISSLEDAGQISARICIPDLYDEVFSRLAKIQPKLLEQAVTLEWGTRYFDHLRAGECQMVLMTIFEWESMSLMQEHNSQCDVLYPGKPFWSGAGGFPMRRDTSDTCSSFLSEVLGSLLAQMDNDGFLMAAYDQYVAKKADGACPQEEEDPDSMKLTFQDMMGVFVVFGMVSCGMMLWASIERGYHARFDGTEHRFFGRSTKQGSGSTDLAPSSDLGAGTAELMPSISYKPKPLPRIPAEITSGITVDPWPRIDKVEASLQRQQTDVTAAVERIEAAMLAQTAMFQQRMDELLQMQRQVLRQQPSEPDDSAEFPGALADWFKLSAPPQKTSATPSHPSAFPFPSPRAELEIPSLPPSPSIVPPRPKFKA